FPPGSGAISMKGCTWGRISVPVKVQITPGTASAAEVSMLTILAWAYGERTNFKYSISRNLMSSANLPRPRSRRFSSLRGRGLPTQFLLSVPELTCWSSASYVLKSRRAALDGQPGAAVPMYLLKGCLQSVNQLLHILSP